MKNPFVKGERVSPRSLFTGVLLAAVGVLAACCVLQYWQLTERTVPAQGRLTRPAVELSVQEQLAAAGLELEDVLAAYREAEPATLSRAYSDCLQKDWQAPAYVRLYPELYVPPPEDFLFVENTVYLTFDDGPSRHTAEVLDILKAREIHATFFVVPSADGSDGEILRRIVQEGHTLGIHSATHEYQRIYSSVENFLEDFAAARNRIVRATGREPAVFRFPGGSLNAYNRAVYQEIIAEMLRRGYVYYDWNVEGGEETHSTPASVIQHTTVSGALGQTRPIILLHDGPDHPETVKALDGILDALKNRGYRFAALDPTVQPVAFAYPDRLS